MSQSYHIDQSMKINSGCLAHIKRRHTHIQKERKKEKELQTTTTTLPVNYNVHW